MSQNIIVMNRGDSNVIKVNIAHAIEELGFHRTPSGFLADGVQIDLNTTDIFDIYFGIMLPHQKFEDAIVRKKFSMLDCDDCYNLYITLVPEDTINLDPGVYYYAIKLRLKGLSEEDPSQVATVINKTKFVIND